MGDHKEYINRKHIQYKKIGHVECPAFSHEKIFFHKEGFNHLIRKGRIPRSLDEQVRRLNLLPYAPEVVATAATIYKFFQREEKGKVVSYWTLRKTINSRDIKVVIRKVGNGKKNFFSIMDG